MKISLKVCAGLAVFLVNGCASHQVEVPASHHVLDIATEVHTVRAVVNRQYANDTLRIYLEGDGRAWVTSSQPSSDPTPNHSHWLDRAMKDPHAIYLARPCQYIKTSLCRQTVWTDARFSREVLLSLNSAIDQIKTIHSAQKIEIIGFSGGAALALLLAAERDDVYQIQTVAGNLDPHAWAEKKGLSPLHGSLVMDEFSERFAQIPQRHFVGRTDKVINLAHTSEFIRKYKISCAQVEIRDTGHNEWDTLKTSELDKPINCTQH